MGLDRTERIQESRRNDRNDLEVICRSMFPWHQDLGMLSLGSDFGTNPLRIRFAQDQEAAA